MQKRLLVGCAVVAVFSSLVIPAAAQDAAGSSAEVPNQFVTLCASCHGEKAQGTDRGPALVDSRKLRGLSEKEIRAVIRDGT